MRRILLSLVLMITVITAGNAQMRAGEVDIFMGVDFNYRDIYHNDRVFDLLLNLTPGVKWNMGKRWELSGQVFVPIVNQYGKYYKYPRVRVATLSKQMAFGKRWRLRATGGIFTAERYGLDLKGMFIINRWLCLTADVGYTGLFATGNPPKVTSLNVFSAVGGPEVYLDRWALQLKARGGRFITGDYGAICELFRHFKHVSVGIFGQYSDIAGKNAGFKVTAMLPPYKRTRRKVNFRPASFFKFNYYTNAGGHSCREYLTDPDQNDRSGWFDPDLQGWGYDSLHPDYNYVEKQAAKTDSIIDNNPKTKLP